MPRFRQAILKLGAGVVLLSCSFLIGFETYPQPGAQNIRLKPFVLHERKLQFSPDNVLEKEDNFTVARRADGSWTESFMMKNPAGKEDGKGILIWDVPNHQTIMLEPFTKSVKTEHLSDAEIADFVRSESCAGIVLPEDRQSTTFILGHPVLQTTEKSDASDSVSWRAVDLDCYALQTTTRLLLPKFKGIYQTSTVTMIDEGSPPDELFAVPSDYTERSPLQIQKEYASKFPGHAFYGSAGVTNAENHYRTHQVSQ